MPLCLKWFIRLLSHQPVTSLDTRDVSCSSHATVGTVGLNWNIPSAYINAAIRKLYGATRPGSKVQRVFTPLPFHAFLYIRYRLFPSFSFSSSWNLSGKELPCHVHDGFRGSGSCQNRRYFLTIACRVLWTKKRKKIEINKKGKRIRKVHFRVS